MAIRMGRRSPAQRAFLVLGTVVLALVLDLALGSLWQAISPREEPPAAVVDAVNLTGSTETVADPRADLPAMASYPWADAYFREVQRTPGTYWPFTEYRPQRFHGEYVNVEDWERRSYEPSGLAGDEPVVWMFGGSTTWGEGQRDEYTIASHLARIAEREGTPIVVRNYGQRGWTHFQEMILFEQLLARSGSPDVALFYDGANDLNAQSLSVKGAPSHVMVDEYAELISGGVAEEFRDTPPPPSALGEVWDAYVEQSALRRAARAVGDLFVDDAGAAPAADVYALTEEDAERAVDVYRRGRELSTTLADRYEVDPLFVWHPTPDGPVERYAADLVDEPTVDLSRAMDDHREVFIDGVHHNEQGAQLVAERLWQELRPRVEAARRADRDGRQSSVTTTTVPQPTTTTTSVVPSTSDDLSTARQKLIEAAGDACRVERWKVWLGALRVADSVGVDTMTALIQDFLDALVAAAPPSASDAAATVARHSRDLPAVTATMAYDPDLAFAPQLPFVEDISSGFLVAFEELTAAIRAQCSTQGGSDG